jgi:hypothetical protein
MCCHKYAFALSHGLVSSSFTEGGLVFPGSFIHTKDKEGNAVFGSEPRDLFTEANFRKFERSWDDGRVATAFFRGRLSTNILVTITPCIDKDYVPQLFTF